MSADEKLTALKIQLGSANGMLPNINSAVRVLPVLALA